MKETKCLFFGSTNLRADRALSGRLVCTSCGNPYGVRKVGVRTLYNFNPFLSKKKYFLFLLLSIVAFILVVL